MARKLVTHASSIFSADFDYRKPAPNADFILEGLQNLMDNIKILSASKAVMRESDLELVATVINFTESDPIGQSTARVIWQNVVIFSQKTGHSAFNWQ